MAATITISSEYNGSLQSLQITWSTEDLIAKLLCSITYFSSQWHVKNMLAQCL